MRVLEGSIRSGRLWPPGTFPAGASDRSWCWVRATVCQGVRFKPHYTSSIQQDRWTSGALTALTASAPIVPAPVRRYGSSEAGSPPRLRLRGTILWSRGPPWLAFL